MDKAAPDNRIVLVEDDAAVRASVSFLLGLDGFDVASYASGEEALANLRACGCYVVDQGLPGMSGLALVERLRAVGHVSPAVLITTIPSAKLCAAAAASGVEIVEKPLIGEALADAIRRASEGGRD